MSPSISLIIVVSPNRGEDSIWETLASFPRHSPVSHEVLVVDGRSPERDARYAREFPWVKRVATPGPVTVSVGRNLAIAVSRGDILAFADDHIRFPPTYLESLVRGFSGGADVVGGSVANANPETSGSWAHYFAEYSKWLAGIPHPDTGDLPGSNWAMRRALYEELGAFAPQTFGLETGLLHRLAAAGKRIRHEPSLVIGHIHETSIMRFWPISFRYGVAYGASLNLSRLTHLGRACAFPVIAATLLVRSHAKASQTREYRRRFWAVSPQLALTFLIRSLGEACGHCRRVLA